MLHVLTDELLNDTIEINQKSRQEYCIASMMISDTRVFDVMHASSLLKCVFNVGLKLSGDESVHIVNLQTGFLTNYSNYFY